eukprot:jgi/Hompol1/952/HPOL_002611-RA
MAAVGHCLAKCTSLNTFGLATACVRVDIREKSALACLSIVLHHETLAAQLSNQTLDGIIEMLIMIITSKIHPRETVMQAIWTLSHLSIPQVTVLEQRAAGLIQALTASWDQGDAGLTEMSLCALSALCVRSVAFCKRHASLWFEKTLLLLFSNDVAVRKSADKMLASVGRHLIDGNDLQDSLITAHNNEPIERFVKLLKSKSDDHTATMYAVGHVLIAFGRKMHKNVELNAFISMIEC